MKKEKQVKNIIDLINMKPERTTSEPKKQKWVYKYKDDLFDWIDNPTDKEIKFSLPLTIVEELLKYNFVEQHDEIEQFINFMIARNRYLFINKKRDMKKAPTYKQYYDEQTDSKTMSFINWAIETGMLHTNTHNNDYREGSYVAWNNKAWPWQSVLSRGICFFVITPNKKKYKLNNQVYKMLF